MQLFSFQSYDFLTIVRISYGFMSITATQKIPLSAQVTLLEQEIEYVRFLNKTGKEDVLRAAAAIRVLDLVKELKNLKSQETQTT